MKRFLLVIALATASPIAAQVVIAAGERAVVAHDRVVELHHGSRTLWTAPGVDYATFAIAGDTMAAVADGWNNRVRVLSLGDGAGKTFATGESPVDGVFIGDELYLLERDAATLTRYGKDGSPLSTKVAADPILVRKARESLYVYSRLDGLLQEIDPVAMRVTRHLQLAASASDMEISGNTAYVLHPRRAEVVAVNLETLAIRSTTAAGAVPLDLAVASGGHALSASRIAIADPGSKRLWITEGAQSVRGAFGRGFLRGLIGLGLFRPASPDFPTGIDRVVSRSGVTLAYDSSAGRLYRARAAEVEQVAENVPPQAFTIAGGRIAFWRAGSLRWVD